MALTKTDSKYILPFLLFVGLGLWSSFYFGYREDKKALALAFRWCFVPSLVFGGIYAYYGGYKRAPIQARWRKILGVLALTLITTLIFLRSFQGFILLINSSLGAQRQLMVSGNVWKVDIPKKKKLLNSYTIYVKDQSGKEYILDVPGTEWYEGAHFDKMLNKGSLGIIYGK
jgi:hypothetical protein